MTRELGKALNRCLMLLVVFAASVSAVSAESVVIVQGYQDGTDRYAANTVDAFVKALSVRDGASVLALRPASQPGWEGGETYADKASLLAALGTGLGSADAVVVIVGDADESGGSLKVAAGATVSASELGAAVARAGRSTIVSAGCNALAKRVADAAGNARIVVAGVAIGQAAHTWPQGNNGQYDLFSRHLLEAFYLLSTGDTSSSIGGLIGLAAHHTSARMFAATGGKQAPAVTGTSPGEAPQGTVVTLAGREYTFVLRAVADGLSGYVTNALGLPIAGITGGNVGADGVTFSFVDRGRPRTVTASSSGAAPAVTLDGKPASFRYRAHRADLVSGNRVIGVAYATPRINAPPRVTVYSEGGAPITASTYDAMTQTASVRLRDGRNAEITLSGFGSVTTRVGDGPTSASVLRYGLVDGDGNRVATLVGLLNGDRVAGELLPAIGQMRLPAEATVTGDGLEGKAELVGTVYTFSSGWQWSTNRPPSSGTVQPDYVSPPRVRSVYANASSAGAVEVTWEVDDGTVTDAILLGDLRFQVVRSGSFGTETFDVPAGRRQFTDRPSGPTNDLAYSVRPILDHRVTTCDGGAAYPILGVAAEATRGVPPAEAPPPEPVVRTPAAPAPEVAPAEPVVAAAPDPVEPAREPAPAPEPQPETKAEEEEEEEDALKPWEKQRSESLGGKVIYGVLGVMILVGLLIAVGAGGSPSDIEPN